MSLEIVCRVPILLNVLNRPKRLKAVNLNRPIFKGQRNAGTPPG